MQMQSAGTIPRGHTHPYRKDSIYILDETPYLSRVDRNMAARIMRTAELYDRATKTKGKHGGELGYVGLAILRVLLYRYSRPGRITSPCYATLQAATGLCSASVREGLKRLQAAKLLTIVRRIVRRQVERVSPWHGGLERYLGTVQAANLYALSLPRSLTVAQIPGAKLTSQNSDKKGPRVIQQSVFDLGDAFSFDRILARRAKAGLGRL